MHAASRVLAAGADFTLLGPDRTMVPSSRPVIAIGRDADRLRARARRRATWRPSSPPWPHAGRHPPSDALRRPRRPARPALRDLRRPRPVRDDDRGARGVRAASRCRPDRVRRASTTRRSCARPRPRPTSSCGTAATTTSRSTGPTCSIVVADPLRAGDERRYHPGETNIRMADVVIINKVDSAEPADRRSRPGDRSRAQPDGARSSTRGRT